MLRPRVIPCLLIQNEGLVKTVGFGSPKYVGDPLNAVRIFNEKEVDELIVCDITATAAGHAPDLARIRRLAAECRMPLCYAGGVADAETVERIVALGVEKVAIGSAAFTRKNVISEAARRVGSQSVVGVIDSKSAGSDGCYEVVHLNGTKRTGEEPGHVAARMVAEGAGEILLNSVDRDGTMLGYDLALAERVKSRIDVPMTVLGGAGSLRDLSGLWGRLGRVGAAAGSLFVFKGRLRAVLINYPDRTTKEGLYSGLSAL